MLVPLAIIFGAGFCAGMINSVAGGGTLVSFPTLIWLGRDPIMANATNATALWPGSLAATYGFRHSLGQTKRWLLLLGLPSVVGSLIGAVLLLMTPTRVFSGFIPFLIFLATVLLAAQEPIGRWLKRYHSGPPSRTWWIGAVAFQFLVAVYGGYFGAGIGIMMLAALSLLRLTDIYQMNALKNFFAVCINAVAAAYFAWSGAIIWNDALAMALGSIAGGYGGAGLARKAGPRVVRGAAVVVGLAMAVSLLLRRH
jgi:uncharacterized protein